MKRMIIWISVAGVLAVALYLAGPRRPAFLRQTFLADCEWDRTVVVDASDRQACLADHSDTVKVMLLSDLPVGPQLEDEINASKILGRRKLKLVQVSQGATFAEQLAALARVTGDPSYFAVIGPTGSERALHAASVLVLSGVPLLPLDAVSPRLSEFSHTLMVRPSAQTEAEALMADFATNGVTRLAIVNDESADWSVRGMAVEDAAVRNDIDVPVHVFFNVNENSDWMRYVAKDRIGTTGFAVLAPHDAPLTGYVVNSIRARFDENGPLRILSLPAADPEADLRRTVWVFAAAFARAEKSGVPTAETFVRAALDSAVETPVGKFSFDRDRFLSPECPLSTVFVR